MPGNTARERRTHYGNSHGSERKTKNGFLCLPEPEYSAAHYFLRQDHARQLNRLLVSDRDCSMAHGCRYSASCSDPEALMHETDRAMYIDKQTYYKINHKEK